MVEGSTDSHAPNPRDPSHPEGVLHERGDPDLPQCNLCGLRVPSTDIIPDLSHQEGMIPWPKISCPKERYDKVSYYDTGCCTVGSGSLSRIWESNTRILDWQNGDRSPGDLVCGLLEEVWEERVAQHVLHCLERIVQRVLHGLERRPYVRGDALNEIPLLLEGIMQACVGVLSVLSLHTGHNGHKSSPPL